MELGGAWPVWWGTDSPAAVYGQLCGNLTGSGGGGGGDGGSEGSSEGMGGGMGEDTGGGGGGGGGTGGGGRMPPTSIAALRRVCEVATPTDFNVFVAAANRVARRPVMQYAGAKWYLAAERADPGFTPPSWARHLLAGGPAAVAAKLPKGPFNGPGVPLTPYGSPATGEMAAGALVAYGDSGRARG
jgi:hypothetical protein